MDQKLIKTAILATFLWLEINQKFRKLGQKEVTQARTLHREKAQIR